MSGRPKDRAISEDEYRRKEADAMQRTADQNRALQSIFGRLRALASDWEANSGSRGLGERSEATAWSKAASQLREAISLSEPQGEPSETKGLNWARAYARRYWQFGGEPETQRALTILAAAVTDQGDNHG